ncbi:transglutaminase-like domain-containing protein [Myroides sp. C8-3]|uniref:transglutaminase-like domain-containing protein n=1 Tax=unclassified Myroides TaxID=2642485 RepID=UPI0015FD593F|nr:transglutaminase family protein [Myroides sp. NP-2]MBB1151078.1 transglutaminase family protein [Myroides sp. NP-2]
MIQISYPIKSSFVYFFLLCSFLVQGQSLAELSEKYKGYNEIILDYKQTYTLTKQKGELVVMRDTYEEYYLLLSDKNNHATSDFTIFSELNPLRSFDAYTLSLQNNKYKKIAPKGITESPFDRNSIFHSDVKKKIVNYSGLTPGSKRILSFTHEFTDPFLLIPFRVLSHLPNEKVTFEIIADSDIELAFRTFNTDNTSITYTQEVKRGKNIHRWTLSNPPLLPYEENRPAAAYFNPSVYFWITSFSTKDKEVSLLGDVDQLYAYYSTFIRTLNTDLDPDFIAFTKALTQGLATEEEKVKTIYQWVQQNIKYIAFEAGYDGFIPRKADLVFERRYGDCKDMTSIITAMCHSIGIDRVYIAWVGTRKIPYSYKELPTPQVDNHMIAFYETGEQSICLDATNSFLPFGLVPSSIQTKELLVALDDSQYKIHKLPVTAATKNTLQTVDSLTIKQAKLESKASLKFRGYFKSFVHANLTYSGRNSKADVVEAIVNRHISNLKLTTLHSIEQLDLSDKPTEIRFDYHIPNAVIVAGNELYVDLNLYKPFQKDNIALPRQTPYEVDELEAYDNTVILNIPPGYRIKYIPENQKLSNAYFEASFICSADQNTVELRYAIASKKLTLYPDDFEGWNETIKKLNTNYLEPIILEKI